MSGVQAKIHKLLFFSILVNSEFMVQTILLFSGRYKPFGHIYPETFIALRSGAVKLHSATAVNPSCVAYVEDKTKSE